MRYADEIKAVFHEVKDIFVYAHDREKWGVVDRWDRPLPNQDGQLYGDCEDFAIECAHRLITRNVPRHMTRLAVCRSPYTGTPEEGYDHAVLIVTEHATFSASDPVLDVNETAVTSVPDLIRKGYGQKWAISRPESIARSWIEVAVPDEDDT